jgi:NADPH-dependent 2,4-dienoyl-CoA reductase/sulfur reductase-like enzyme/flavodoxin
MSEAKIIEKELGENKFKILLSGESSAIFDTVPFDLSAEWLKAAPNAETLILCKTNPYPKTVKSFLEARPNGKVYAPPYILYTLSGILGDSFKGVQVRDNVKAQVGDTTVKFTLVSQPGKSSYIVADAGEAGTVSGAEEDVFASVEKYAEPTVAIAYVSGCDYTEMMAEKISQGVRDSGGVATRLIDIASMDVKDVARKLAEAQAVMIGTPTVNGEAHKKVWELLTAMSGDKFFGKFATAFGSYTWNGDGVAHVIERLHQLNMNVTDSGFSVQYKPGENELNSTYEFGYSFGCTIQDKPNSHRSKLVKCLVCGEIFDSSLGVCPVCGVGMDKCVPVEDEVIGYSEDTNRTYLVLGGGIAALSSAEAIRKRDKTGKIIMISAENVLPINRPMLSKNIVLCARVPKEMSVKTPDWFEENSIEIRLNTKALRIDAENKKAYLSDGSEISYHKLIYALGAECFVPNIPGKDLNGVISIRHLSDVDEVWSRIKSAKKVVVIGGGVLGLEAASEMKKLRLEVTVLEMAPKIMSRQLDDETGEALIEKAAQFGVKVATGVNITKITGSSNVTGVELSDGTVYPADMVIMSCGNRANIDVAKEAGIDCDRAILVTERMETSNPDIYACGDCAQFNGVNYQLWAEATEQGRVAGANAVGDKAKYEAIPYGASFEGMNTALFAIGDVGKAGKDYKLLENRDEIAGSFTKYYFADSKLTGAILFGNTEKIQIVTDALINEETYVDLKDRL